VDAVLPFSSGLGIILRCDDGDYQAALAGPPATGHTRELRIAVQDGQLHPQTWNVGARPDIALADIPAFFARSLRAGGKLAVVIPGGAGDGRNLRHEVELPPSTASIDATLAACGRPLVDPRDALLGDIGPHGLPAEITWRVPPRPDYPPGPMYSRAYAVVSCLAQPSGALSDCLVESEFPHGQDFGRTAVRAARRASVRINYPPGAPVAPRRISFRVNYIVTP